MLYALCSSWNKSLSARILLPMRLVVRLFALVLLLGQLVQASGGAFCGLQRRHHAEACDQMGRVQRGSAVAPLQSGTLDACMSLGPCAPPIVAVGPAHGPSSFLLAEFRLAAPLAPDRPRGFDAAPIPPPPQA